MDHETAFVSSEILDEFRRKCVQKLKLSTQDVERLATLILERANSVKLRDFQTPLPKNIPLRDLADRHVLELAFLVGADLILSWDKDLTDLHKVKKTQIMTPRKFWDSLPRLG